MIERTPADQPIIRDFGDGLVLRRATSADTEALAALNALTLAEPGWPESSHGVAVCTRDLASRPHPTFAAGGFTLVEDTRSGAIVSSLCLIPQTWTYGGIPFGVGRIELVSTRPEYRRRGLVRSQMEVAHQWSAELGHSVQVISGIRNFYRQFGYEMGLSMEGGRTTYPGLIPELKDGAVEAFHVRRAEDRDLAFLAQTYEQAERRHLVTCLRDQTVWRYELSGHSEDNIDRMELRVVETAAGEPVGMLVHHPWSMDQRLGVIAYELKSGVSWLAVTPSVLRYLDRTAKEYAARSPRERYGGLAFRLGLDHPVYQAMPDTLPRAFEPYAWYVRVADLLGFLRQVAPALERNLADSVAAGHSAEIRVSFYRWGLRLGLENGKLSAIERWQPTPEERGLAGFPYLTFLQLLFGYRSLDELKHAYADCWAKNEEVRVLLSSLFPKRPSNVWALE